MFWLNANFAYIFTPFDNKILSKKKRNFLEQRKNIFNYSFDALITYNQR